VCRINSLFPVKILPHFAGNRNPPILCWVFILVVTADWIKAPIKLAEACENRTHQRQDRYRSTGFEVQAAHQDRSASSMASYKYPDL